MRSHGAWLAAIAAALGVSEAACKREASVTTIAPVTSAAPSASAAPIIATTEAPSASASVAPSAVEVASARPVPTAQPRSHPLACGAMPVREQSAICGASPNVVKNPTATINASVNTTNDADRAIVASLRARFRSCATRGLLQDPNEQGTIVVSATIDATGQVTAASLASSSGLGSGTAACMVTAVRSKPFGAGAPRTIQIQIQSTKEN